MKDIDIVNYDLINASFLCIVKGKKGLETIQKWHKNGLLYI